MLDHFKTLQTIQQNHQKTSIRRYPQISFGISLQTPRQFHNPYTMISINNNKNMNNVNNNDNINNNNNKNLYNYYDRTRKYHKQPKLDQDQPQKRNIRKFDINQIQTQNQFIHQKNKHYKNVSPYKRYYNQLSQSKIRFNFTKDYEFANYLQRNISREKLFGPLLGKERNQEKYLMTKSKIREKSNKKLVMFKCKKQKNQNKQLSMRYDTSMSNINSNSNSNINNNINNNINSNSNSNSNMNNVSNMNSVSNMNMNSVSNMNSFSNLNSTIVRQRIPLDTKYYTKKSRLSFQQDFKNQVQQRRTLTGRSRNIGFLLPHLANTTKSILQSPHLHYNHHNNRQKRSISSIHNLSLNMNNTNKYSHNNRSKNEFNAMIQEDNVENNIEKYMMKTLLSDKSIQKLKQLKEFGEIRKFYTIQGQRNKIKNGKNGTKFIQVGKISKEMSTESIDMRDQHVINSYNDEKSIKQSTK